MKKRDLERELQRLGFWRADGSKHDKWTNGIHTDTVPRHIEINEFTAKQILRRCRDAPKAKAQREN
jgi:hypothetical protein